MPEEITDDFIYAEVPDDQREGRFKVHMAGWSMVAGMIWLFYGALAGTLVGTKDAVIGLVISAILLAAVNLVMVHVGVRSGLGSPLVGQGVFGRSGEALTSIILILSAVYFAAFESSVIAIAFHQYWAVDIRVLYVVVVALMIPMMLGGVMTWLDKINAFLLPIYLVGLVVIVVAVAMKGNTSGMMSYAGAVPPEAQIIPGWLTTVVLYLGIWLVLPTTIDFTRFARTEDHGYMRIMFGPLFTLLTLVINGVVGIILVLAVLPRDQAASEGGAAVALVELLGIVGLLFIVVTQVRINTLNFYLSSTNLQRLLKGYLGIRAGRPVVVAAVAIIVILLMLTEVFSYMQLALAWLGIFFVGWAVIVSMSILLVGLPGRTTTQSGKVTVFTTGMLVWLVSATAGIVALQMDGTFPRASAVAPIIALVVAGIGYLPIALKLRGATAHEQEQEAEIPSSEK